MSTFAQKCAEFEVNFHRLRIQRDNWQPVLIDEALPRLGGTTPEDFISQYYARPNRKLFFVVCGGNAERNRKHGVMLNVAGQKRKVVYLKSWSE